MKVCDPAEKRLTEYPPSRYLAFSVESILMIVDEADGD